MNLVARQIYGNTSNLGFNTEIWGVSATISTAALLATKLAIDVSRISNFTIVGSDIKCRITGSYGIPATAFSFNTTPCTNYRDLDYLITSVGANGFYATNAFVGYDADFQNCLTVESAAFSSGNSGGGANRFLLKNATTIGNNCFSGDKFTDSIYIPNCTSLGSTSGDNQVFNNNDNPLKLGVKIYCHPSLATNNAGAPDGDLAWVIANRGAIVRYVTNFTSPNPITNLAVGTIYNTAVQLNFTPPSSTNAIEYYECYADGVLKNRITASGQYITDLTPSTSHNVTLIAVDIFYNKSVVGNSLSVTTTSDLSDTDASAYTTASSNTVYQYIIQDLYKQLKDNSLYTKLQAFYPFLGTTAAQHKWNGKNPLDTNAAFRLTFSGGGTHSDLGYQCNGSNAYANTYFIPSANQNVNSNGLTLVCGTNNAAASSNVVEIGGYVGATQANYLMVKNNNTNYKRRISLSSETPEVSQTGINESRGVFTGSRQSATNTDLFVNGAQVATANVGGSLPNIALFIGALNFGGSGITFSNQRIQFTAIHEGLSDAEVATLHTIIDIFETALGRKTW